MILRQKLLVYLYYFNKTVVNGVFVWYNYYTLNEKSLPSIEDLSEYFSHLFAMVDIDTGVRVRASLLSFL